MRRAQDARDRGKWVSNREKKVAQTTALTAQAEGLSPPSYDQHIVARRLKSFITEELLVLEEGWAGKLECNDCIPSSNSLI
jgi:hypothetical protein